ncbi:hypothetical protein BS50DRAFT_651193 [Corynespora cassiicola Philippines]|uniref:Uncharacterized protein n=1 Tax=Corynespora cassiicola Philippines TaxID=1448308 RepID=A0A2T2N8P1_CORCC|nr:hypothetical protein BS50DRAFT_651193 [Corynespora cassiicola Philippines]
MGEALNLHDMAFEDPRTAKRPRTSFLNKSIHTVEFSHLRNLGFLSLPGEIRNTIYDLTLVADGPISVCHSHVSKGLVFFRDCDGPLSLESAKQAFLKLTSLNTQIYWEAASYFYANNTILLQTRGILTEACSATRYEPAENDFWLYGNNSILRDEVPYIPTQMTLLQGIGACGRKFITSLKLDYWAASEIACVMDKRAFFDEFFSMLKTCTNLKALAINFEMAMAFVGDHASFPGTYSFIGPVLEDFARNFIDIGKLERLVIFTDGIKAYVSQNWPLTWSGDDVYIVGMLDWAFQEVFDDYERRGNKRVIVEVQGC